VAYWQRFL